MVESIPPVVLMYHGVPRSGVAQALNAKAFEQHILWLKRKCTFVQPEQYSTKRGSLQRPTVLLTFDDGFRNNAVIVAPLLRRHSVPAVFFVTSRHCTPGKYMWFTYLKMLARCYLGDGVTLNGKFISLKGSKRREGIAELRRQLLALRPHPGAMHNAIDEQLPPIESFVSADLLADECAGMTAEQVAELANDPLFTVGGHTLDHPSLTLCTADQAQRQILENKTWLERVTGRPCDLFSYPLGDFDVNTVTCCHHFGFRKAFAVQGNGVEDSQYAIHRVGVYSRPLPPLAIKLWCEHLALLALGSPDITTRESP